MPEKQSNKEKSIQLDQTIDSLVKKPYVYKVIMYNDDAIPNEWLSKVLVNVFNYTKSDADDFVKLLNIEEIGIVGIYTFEIAEQKIIEAKSFSYTKGYMIEFGIEKD